MDLNWTKYIYTHPSASVADCVSIATQIHFSHPQLLKGSDTPTVTKLPMHIPHEA